jgi:xylan 1,4-beta-xylosidase
MAKSEAKLQHFRIDQNHSNAFAEWKRMGSPQQPTPEQYGQLEKAGHLAAFHPAQNIQVENGKATMSLMVPRQAVSLLQFTW